MDTRVVGDGALAADRGFFCGATLTDGGEPEEPAVLGPWQFSTRVENVKGVAKGSV